MNDMHRNPRPGGPKACPAARAFALVLAALVMLVLAVPGCNEPASPRGQIQAKSSAAEPCAAEPLAPFDCAQEGALSQTSIHFSAQVVSIAAPDELGRWFYFLREASGMEHRLVVQAPDPGLPVVTGQTYDFEVERVGGMPAASALLVRDPNGLLFAGASDQGVGDHVLRGGVPEVALQLLPSRCASRAQGDCFDAAFNRALEVSRGGEHVELFQGDRVSLGGYEVHCLIAQQVSYNARCRDFALVGASYTIARVK